ncbi:MAG: YfhO family protein [Firmicutes bacterium]|nr:YfhO family protein [Bacillota bacterium]
MPIIILGTAFALNGVYPGGGRQIIVGDFWIQYYPFISDFWHKLREGGSLLWSWTDGAGHDYLAHMAYYLASPFNFLVALFPHKLLGGVLTTFLLVKLGLAGLFMGMYLRYIAKREDMLLPFFSLGHL